MLFEGNRFKEAADGQTKIDDIPAQVMETLLHFVYKDHVAAHTDINVDLLKAADYYDIQGLVAICTSYFQNNLTVENALEIMTAAALTNSKPLLAAAIKFAMKHRGFLNKTSGWDEVKKNYPEITSQVLDEILFNP